jgi:hypothetical protein
LGGSRGQSCHTKIYKLLIYIDITVVIKSGAKSLAWTHKNFVSRTCPPRNSRPPTKKHGERTRLPLVMETRSARGDQKPVVINKE